MRSSSISNVSVLPWMPPDQLVPDLIAILESTFFLVGDIDR
jgi:NADH:ubiquinone oxidoreductase subunit D